MSPHLSPAAGRTLARLSRKDRALAERVRAAVDRLADDPKPPASKRLTGPFSGMRALRVGPYRVLYHHQRGHIVVIETVGRRGSCYPGHHN